MDRLKGKVAVVTGAGSGIGAAAVKAFCKEGARVVAVDISGTQQHLARDIGACCSPFRADVSKSADVKAMFDHAIATFGQLDILFNNAGISGSAALTADYKEEEFDRVMAINCRSVFLGMKFAIPLMEQNGGAIVNTASIGGVVAFPERVGYCAAKAAVLMLTKTTAAEYASHRIRVNAICPGPVKTAMTANASDDIREKVINSVPARRMAEPEEIAALAVYLASDESSFVTGAHIMIDGGYTVL